MNHRAHVEKQRLLNGEQIAKIHTEALRDFRDIQLLINGGFDFLRYLKIPAKGIVADLGSGTGMGATVLSKQPDIQKVYAIEFSEQFVLEIMPEVFSQFRAEQSKIIRVVGDFNNIELEDGSLAVILDVDSFHHSEDLNATLKECHRVLQPGGVIISIDRAWPDTYTREELDAMLDREYNDATKKLFGIPVGQSFTRRDYGEHEYTIKEWAFFYKQNGFETNVCSLIHPPALNRIFLKLPTFQVSIFLASIFSKLGMKRHYIYGFNPTRKLFISIKK